MQHYRFEYYKGKRSIIVRDNKSRNGYSAFTSYIIRQVSKGLSRSTFYDFITVQFVHRDKKTRGTPTREYWTRNRCSRQASRLARRLANRLPYKQARDFSVNLRWRLRRKQ